MSCDTIVQDQETRLSVSGYQHVRENQLCVQLLCVLFFPILPLALYWKRDWWAKVAFRSASLQTATDVLIKRGELIDLLPIQIIKDNGEIINAKNTKLHNDATPFIAHDELEQDQKEFRFFVFGAVRFVWSEEENNFKRQSALDSGHSISHIQQNYATGISNEERVQRRNWYGPNSIEILVPSYMKLLIEEVLNPFYIFQIFSVVLWGVEEYYYYAVAILIITVLSVTVSLKKTKQQAQDLHDMVSGTNSATRYNQDGEIWETIDSRDLVPGDLVQIQNGQLQADVLLLSGTTIVNEAMLTGESAPEQKEPATGIQGFYCPDKHRRHTLFAGTTVVQARVTGAAKKVTGVVVRVGFYTAKGDLVRSIMFPSPVGFGFYEDAIRFIGLLAILAALGDIYSFYIFYVNQENWWKSIMRILDLITVVVPPSLPCAMTVGTVYSQSRLKKRNIFCISPARINVAGKIKVCCFDKTGTLTEEGLDFWGVMKADDMSGKPVRNPKAELGQDSNLLQAIASCHSLTVIDGDLIGDPLDIKMFQSTGWHYQDSENDGTLRFPTVKPITADSYSGSKEGLSIAILKNFPFSSELQRQSVIVRSSRSKNPHLFLKGAPEAVAARCATLPACFSSELDKLTRRGFRVLAMAGKELDLAWHKVDRVEREICETDLTFLGLLVMQNQLKDASAHVLKELANANIRSLMVTGDNLLTAIAVSRDCELLPESAPVFIVSVDTTSATPKILFRREGDGERSKDWHLAIIGKDWQLLRQHFPEKLPYIVQRGAVFARMSPDQKAQLIEELQKIDYQVVMCGDGANDCAALKLANAGVSLSDSEASVAAPFTASCGDISCIPTLIREGRAALITSFGIFKYMALYSLIQFISVLILYTFDSNLGDIQFLWVDLAITTTVAVFMSRNGAWPVLIKKRPPGSLVNPIIIVSLLTQITGVAFFQGLLIADLRTRDWYTEVSTNRSSLDENIVCMENTVIFSISSFQYLILALAFSQGPPYRTRIWKNLPFLVSLLMLGSVTTMLIITPTAWMVRGFEMAIYNSDWTDNVVTEAQSVPLWYRWLIMGLVVAQFSFSIFVEDVLIKSESVRKIFKIVRQKRMPKNKYKRIEMEIQSRSAWMGAITIPQTDDSTESNSIKNRADRRTSNYTLE